MTGESVLCWGAAPVVASDWNIILGTFIMNGPHRQELACPLSAPCAVQITGVGLVASNRIRLVVALVARTWTGTSSSPPLSHSCGLSVKDADEFWEPRVASHWYGAPTADPDVRNVTDPRLKGALGAIPGLSLATALPDTHAAFDVGVALHGPASRLYDVCWAHGPQWLDTRGDPRNGIVDFVFQVTCFVAL